MSSSNGVRPPYEYGSEILSSGLSERSRVGPRLEDGLRAGLHSLELFATSNVLRFDPERTDQPAIASRVDLYKIHLGVVLPIGVGDVAEGVRAALTGGFDGWVMPQLTEPDEPLWRRKQQLPGRLFNTLERYQFRTVDEVALVPDTGLLELRGMGPGSLRKLRTIIPARDDTQSPSPPATSPDSGHGTEEDTVATAMGVLHEMRDLLTAINTKLDTLLLERDSSREQSS